MYTYLCPKCNWHSSEPTKEDWAITKHNHKCDLVAAMDEKDKWVLARRDLALKMREESDKKALEAMEEDEKRRKLQESDTPPES
jgi:hypothetical protein